MKKLILALIVVIVALISLVVVTIYNKPTEEDETVLTEAEAKELALDQVDGEIENIKRTDDQYEITMKDNDETVTVIVDDKTKKAVVVNNEQATSNSKKTDSTSSPNESKTKQEASQTLPLTKDGAMAIAKDFYEGEIENVVLVQTDGQKEVYEITMTAEKEEAVLKIDKATGEVTEVMVSDTTTKNTAIQSVANSIGQSSKTNETNQSPVTTINKPSTSKLDEAAIKERIANEMDGTIQQVQLTNANIYEVTVKQNGSTYIVKVNPYTGTIISKMKK